MGPKNAVIWKNGGENPRYWFRDPQKALHYTEPRRLTYFASKLVRASRLQPFSRTKEGREITHEQNLNP